MNAHDARARSEELIARVNETLARPRPEGPTWQAPQPHVAEKATTREPPAAAGLARPEAAGVSRALFEAVMANHEKAIGKVFAASELAWQRRALEAERRLLALEARLDRLEGKRDG